jgi:protease-4
MLEDDKRIKAIVLRINSPGGTVAATQEIYDKLMKLRKKNIVLVASMGELAASGGYYVASACNHVMANRGTITGSIGVIAVSPISRGSSRSSAYGRT